MAYMPQSKKAEIAAKLKSVIPAGWKYSLSVRNCSEIVLTIQSAPLDLLAKMNAAAAVRGELPMDYVSMISAKWLEKAFEGEALAVMERIADVLNDGNYDRSDIQTDYFDVGWYSYIGIGRFGKPFVNTAAPVALAA